MAATSPRKPRRTNGRHRKPSAFEASNCAQWLRIGTVSVGLGAAIVGSQGIASAAPDDSSHSTGPDSGTGHAKSERSSANATAGPRSPSARAGQPESQKQDSGGVTQSTTISSHQLATPANPTRPGERSAADVTPDDRLASRMQGAKPVQAVGRRTGPFANSSNGAPPAASAPSAVSTAAVRSAPAVTALPAKVTDEIRRAPTGYISALNDALDSMGLGPLGGPVQLPGSPRRRAGVNLAGRRAKPRQARRPILGAQREGFCSLAADTRRSYRDHGRRNLGNQPQRVRAGRAAVGCGSGRIRRVGRLASSAGDRCERHAPLH